MFNCHQRRYGYSVYFVYTVNVTDRCFVWSYSANSLNITYLTMIICHESKFHWLIVPDLTALKWLNFSNVIC